MARNTTRRLHGKALPRFYTQDVVSFGAAIAAADEDQPTTWLMLVTAMLLAVGAAYTISLELAPRVVGIPAGTFDAQPAYEQVRPWAPTAQLQPKPQPAPHTPSFIQYLLTGPSSHLHPRPHLRSASTHSAPPPSPRDSSCGACAAAAARRRAARLAPR